MLGRLDQIAEMLREQLGDALLAVNPELVYNINHILVRFFRTADTPKGLWCQLDSLLFNTVYAATNGQMSIMLTGGRRMRVTAVQLTDLADRLLSLSYGRMPVSRSLQDALFDLSREGSFAAMRELLARFPLGEDERQFITQVLFENGQTA